LNFLLEDPEGPKTSLVFLLLVEELGISFDGFLMLSYGLLLSIGNEGLAMLSHSRRRILMSGISPVFASCIVFKVHSFGYCRVVKGKRSPIILQIDVYLLFLIKFGKRVPKAQLIEETLFLLIFPVELRLTDAVFCLLE
jgi:hypothetical protein